MHKLYETERKEMQYWDNLEFVKTWMKSDTVEIVAKKLNRTVLATSQKASALRSKGVNLPKKLRSYQQPDSVEALNKLIDRMSK